MNGQEAPKIIGGVLFPPASGPYAAFVSSGDPEPISLGSPTGSMLSAGINSSGTAILGGNLGAPPYAAFVSPLGGIMPISLPFATGSINSVSINSSGAAIIGGRDTTGMMPAYAALVSSSGMVIDISLGLPNGTIRDVAINDSGQGIVGGQDLSGAQPPFAALVSSSGGTTPLALGLTDGNIRSVAINSSGRAIISGQDESGAKPPYAALITSTGTVNPTSHSFTTGLFDASDINDSGEGIVAGDADGAPYAAFVSSMGDLTAIPLSLGAGSIEAAAINNSGQVLLGGRGGGNFPIYAALISASGVETPLFDGTFGGVINSVGINEQGQGIIAGEDFTIPFGPAIAYLVSPTGTLTEIPLGIPNGSIFGAAIADLLSPPTSLLSNIPTSFLSGNNLIFANYINQNASDKAFFFVPSVADGTLSQALEPAAPTRNAFSLNTAANNLFFFISNLSTHLHSSQVMGIRKPPKPDSMITSSQERLMTFQIPIGKDAGFKDHAKPEVWEDSIDEKEQEREAVSEPDSIPYPRRINRLWFQTIGSLADQDAQSQTPSFQPASIGCIAAYERELDPTLLIGAGASYLFTHIHEKEGAGHSDVNQESLFAYASWNPIEKLYFDFALWGGFFQTDQVRKIRLTGFEFTSESDPNGGQLLAHTEAGWSYNLYPVGWLDVILNPFAMVDWGNIWQEGYVERGGGPFNAGQSSHYASLLRTEVGIRCSEIFFFQIWNLIFQQKGSYVNTQSFDAGDVTAFLVGSPNTFTVQTLTDAQHLGAVLFMAAFEPHDPIYPTGSVFYQGQFGTGYQSHQLTLGLDWTF